MDDEKTPLTSTPTTEEITSSQAVPPVVTVPETYQNETVAGAQPTETEPIDSAQGKTAQIPANEPLPPEPEPIPTTVVAPASASAPLQRHAAPTVAEATAGKRDLLMKARAMMQDRKRKKLQKILELLNMKSKITNDEVEKLLHVSDATATRYLSLLEKEGKIHQVGKTGAGVVYTKV